MSFALFIIRVILYVSSIMFCLAGLDDLSSSGYLTAWGDSLLFCGIMLNMLFLLDVVTGEDEPMFHCAMFGAWILVIIDILHIYGS